LEIFNELEEIEKINNVTEPTFTEENMEEFKNVKE